MRACERACVCMCVCVCLSACVRACVCVLVRVRTHNYGGTADLSEITKTQTHAAYAALTHGFASKWTFLSRTIDNICDLLQPLEDCLRQHLIPNLTGRSLPGDKERAMLAGSTASAWWPWHIQSIKDGQGRIQELATSDCPSHHKDHQTRRRDW